MPSPFEQATGYGFWVSEVKSTTQFLWWQALFWCGLFAYKGFVS